MYIISMYLSELKCLGLMRKINIIKIIYSSPPFVINQKDKKKVIILLIDKKENT
jgi:hypothetical protein